MISVGLPFNLFSTKGKNILALAATGSDPENIIDTSSLSDQELEQLIKDLDNEISQNDKEINADLLQAFENDNLETIDLKNMTKNQIDSFTKYIEKEVESIDLPTEEDEESYKQVMLDFFNSDSEIYGNIEEATTELISEIDSNHSSPFDNLSGEEVLAAKRGWVSVTLLGSVVNTTINLVLIGSGVGSIWALVKKKGIRWVRDKFQSRLKARLVKWFGAAIGVYYTFAWDLVMTVADPGTRWARYIDSRDKIRNNGYIELW